MDTELQRSGRPFGGASSSFLYGGAIVAGLKASTHWLALIFSRPEDAAREFLRANQDSALRLFLRLHAPLLVLYPLAGLLCPAVHLGAGRFSFVLHAILPLLVVLGALIFAVFIDQVARFAQHPRMEIAADEKRVKNLALFLHLPLSAVGIFFIIHPVAGYFMLCLALLYSLWISMNTTAIYYEISRARVLVYVINALLLGIVPIVVLVLIGNILRNLAFLDQLL